MQTARIESLCSKVTSGGTPSRKQPKFYADGSNGHLWVKSKELLDGAIYDTEERISDEGLRRSSAKYLPANTTLMAMYGANVGQLGWLKRPATVNQAVCGMVVDETIADPRYVFYALLQTRPSLTAKAQGAAQQNLNQGLIKEFEIPAPSLKVQKRIATILSTYDDLIENNLRRIKILEEMAQNLYREWFVKFRFPGHEQVRMVDSTLGKVPVGWEVMSVSEAVNLNPKLNIEKDKEKFFVPMSGLSTDSMVITEFKYRTGNNGAKFQNGDTLFARITPSTEHGKTSFVQCLTSDDEVAFGSTEYIVMRSKNLNPYAVYFLARELDFREHAIRSMTGASGRQRVQVSCFDYFFVATSTQDVLDKFEQAVTPNFRLIQNLWDKNRALHQTRDLLLPKLISGELDVSELDIDIGEAA